MLYIYICRYMYSVHWCFSYPFYWEAFCFELLLGVLRKKEGRGKTPDSIHSFFMFTVLQSSRFVTFNLNDKRTSRKSRHLWEIILKCSRMTLTSHFWNFTPPPKKIKINKKGSFKWISPPLLFPPIPKKKTSLLVQLGPSNALGCSFRGCSCLWWWTPRFNGCVINALPAKRAPQLEGFVDDQHPHW